MSENIITVQSISDLHLRCGFEKPKHPLISIIDVSQWEITEEMVGVKTTSNLYSIGMKDKSCGLQYGRNHYDFDEGVMFFAAPNQIQQVSKPQSKGEVKGWMIFFHPDLIRNTALGQTIDSFRFFSYDVFEALHLSEMEQNTVNDCVGLIQQEINERIDNHSQTVICSSLELLLNLSRRFYERQFNTRSAQNSDILSQFHSEMKAYFRDGLLIQMGQPSVEYFAEKAHLSTNYFNDLIKKETAKNVKEHINDFIIERAKTILLRETTPISNIAYDLGFNYPHYFSRLFKSKTGMTPQEYRHLN